jgi:hypothetical protein
VGLFALAARRIDLEWHIAHVVGLLGFEVTDRDCRQIRGHRLGLGKLEDLLAMARKLMLEHAIAERGHAGAGAQRPAQPALNSGLIETGENRTGIGGFALRAHRTVDTIGTQIQTVHARCQSSRKHQQRPSPSNR